MAARKRPEERREEILRAAGEVVLREGFGRTSVRDLAAEIGVSPGLLHHYFPSLDEVMVRAVELFRDEDLEQLDAALTGGAAGVGEAGAALPPLVRLDRALRFCVTLPEDQTTRFWVESWAEALRNPGLSTPIGELNEAWVVALAGLVEEAVARGDAECDDPRGTALRLVAALDGLAVQGLVHRAIGPGDLLPHVRRTAELELGLAPGTLAASDDPGSDVTDRAPGPTGPRHVRTARGPAA